MGSFCDDTLIQSGFLTAGTYDLQQLEMLGLNERARPPFDTYNQWIPDAAYFLRKDVGAVWEFRAECFVVEALGG